MAHIKHIDACFLGNATRNFVGLGFGRIFTGRSLFTLTNTIIRTYKDFGCFFFSVVHSRAANLGEVSSALLGAQLSLALVGYELYWSLAEVRLFSPALGLNRKHFVEGLISSAALQTNFYTAGIQQVCFCWVDRFLGSILSHFRCAAMDVL
jgi:hypothetical protein